MAHPAGRELRAAAEEPASHGRDVAEFRLSAYASCLGVAFALYLAVHGRGHGVVFWVWAVSALVALGRGLLTRERLTSRWLRAGATGIAALALVFPFGLAALQGEALAAIRPFWPQMLVLLFASRVLGEADAALFDAFWRAPLRAAGPVVMQSGAAALALGGVLTLLFYQSIALLGLERPFSTSLAGVLLGAVSGESAIHRGIVFLFFVVLAHLANAAMRHGRDRQALHALQLAVSDPTGPSDRRSLVATFLRDRGRTRTALLVQDALAGAAGEGPSAATIAFETFRLASRRFVRGLVTLLPLLGFLGTVVGLATAMGGLPLDGGAGGRIDLTASLAGLALKFETTMLGLVASMIAALLLAALDRSEAEHAAACAMVAEALRAEDRGTGTRS